MLKKIYLLLSLLITLLSYSVTRADDEVLIWKTECQSNNIVYQLPNYISVVLTKEDSYKKRCEISTNNFLSLDNDFIIEFDFIPETINYNDFEWHTILQFHSFPDLDSGESWRCPIGSLEIKNGELRMFSRSDSAKVSTLQNGTCANAGNSIHGHNLFSGYKLFKNNKYKIKIYGRLTYKSTGYLRVLINGKELVNYEGANAYNDKQGPFLKFGIYKPTSWKPTEEIKYRYENIIFTRGISEN